MNAVGRHRRRDRDGHSDHGQNGGKSFHALRMMRCLGSSATAGAAGVGVPLTLDQGRPLMQTPRLPALFLPPYTFSSACYMAIHTVASLNPAGRSSSTAGQRRSRAVARTPPGPHSSRRSPLIGVVGIWMLSGYHMSQKIGNARRSNERDPERGSRRVKRRSRARSAA